MCQIVVIFLVCLLPLSIMGSLPNLEYNSSILHFVPGTVAEYLEDPIFYDAYLPLVFQFQVPKHMDNAMKIMWQHATVCNVSDSRYEGKLCPIVHHLHKVVANLSADMGFWKDFLPPLDSGGADGITLITEHHDPYPTTTTTFGTTTKPRKASLRPPTVPNCAEITPHFRHTYTSPQHLEDYLSSLENCPLGSPHMLTQQPTNWIIDKQIYYTMVDRFYTEFYRTLPGTGNIDWVVTLNSYVNIQGLLLANNYMESNRVMNAFLQCGQQLIPNSFVKPEVLRAALKENKGKVYNNHFQYLWDYEGDDLQSYYKLPVADCTFTQDFKLVVRILIPVKTPDVETRLLQVRTFPFMQKLPMPNHEHSLQMCKLQSPGSIRIIQSNFGLLFENRENCEPRKLCARHNLNSYLPMDACISSILSGNESLVRSGCKLSCFPVDLRSLPVFQRSSPDTFLALGTSENKIFIQCNGQPLEKLGLVDLGVLEIRLSCNCQISYRSLVLSPSSTCSGGQDEMIKVRRLLPLHWEDKLQNDRNNNGSIIASLDKYYHYDVTTTTDDNQEKSSDKQISIQPSGESSLSAGMVTQICLLWILVIVLVISNGYLFYQLHRLIQWKKIQAYKDTRIVYSVPASPQFPNKF